MGVLARPDARQRGGSPSLTATRVLIMLDVLGAPVDKAGVPDAVAVISGLMRVQKLDFWMRNPDYLADELLTEYESNRVPRAAVASHVSRMLAGGAPSLHTYPMERYLYGAYEFMDNALAILKAYGLIAQTRAADSGALARRDYFLLERGRSTVATMRSEIPEIAWYDAQAEAIGLIADSRQGASAKRRQYEQPEYNGAAHGSLIPTIVDRVRARASSLGI